MPSIKHPEDVRCCGRCKSVPPICAMKYKCPCHAEGLARSRQIIRTQTALASREDHWGEAKRRAHEKPAWGNSPSGPVQPTGGSAE